MITGKELAEKILDQAENQPETLNMDAWKGHLLDARGKVCGTTYCIAGWAVEFNRRPDESVQAAKYRLAEELDTSLSWHDLGRSLLALTNTQADLLFYTTEDDAKNVLRRVFEL